MMAVDHSLAKGGDAMGKSKWMKVLRFLLCLLIALAVITYMTPKAC